MRFLLPALLLACAEQRLPPTFPLSAAGRPVVAEQALLGLSEAGDAAVVQLTDAEGAAPELTLAIFCAGGSTGDTKPPSASIMSPALDTAPRDVAKAVAERVRAAGHRASTILAAALAAEWPEATARAAALGFSPRAPATPEPGRRRYLLAGAPAIGSLPLALRLIDTGDAQVLLLSERPGGGTGAGEEVELARMPLGGVAVAPELWVQNGMAWLLSGSVLPGDPLHRTVGLRRASIARGEAQLHNLHGLSDYGAGDLDAARREFDRAIAADATFADALYNAAAAAALSDRPEQAVGLLKRAAALDPERVQVLGRNDDDLKDLRRRPDVRALLGLKRPPPDKVPPPP